MDPISFAAAFVHTQQNLKFFMLILTTYFKVREKFSYPQAIYLNLVVQNPRVLVQSFAQNSILKNNPRHLMMFS